MNWGSVKDREHDSEMLALRTQAYAESHVHAEVPVDG